MREELPALLAWWRAGEPVAVATVVRTFVSAPRSPGATMLVGPDGSAVGSVSGGCVEGDVHERGRRLLAGEGAPGVVRYGVSDDDAFAVGLTCGGTIDVFLETVDPAGFPELAVLAELVAAGEPVALATVVAGPADRVGRHLLVRPDGQPDDRGSAPGTGLGSDRLDDAVRDDARGLLAAGRTGTLEYGPDGERLGDGLTVFVGVFAPPPRMVVVGAIDFAAALARQAALLGYRVTVCDARPVFATRERFPEADEVVVDWPHRYLAAELAAGRLGRPDAVCLLTHDDKFDVPALTTLLSAPVDRRPGYLGAMGSRRTHEARAAALHEQGVDDAAQAALHSPIGLDLGARTPQETAVSIVAEIIATRWEGGGRSLRETTGAIHRDPTGATAAAVSPPAAPG